MASCHRRTPGANLSHRCRGLGNLRSRRLASGGISLPPAVGRLRTLEPAAYFGGLSSDARLLARSAQAIGPPACLIQIATILVLQEGNEMAGLVQVETKIALAGSNVLEGGAEFR